MEKIRDEDFAQNLGTCNKRLEVWDHYNIFNGHMMMWVNLRENDLPKMCIIDSRSQKMAEVQSFILTHYEVKRLIECFTIVLDKMPEEKNFK